MIARDPQRAWCLLALFVLVAGVGAIAQLGVGPGIIMALFLVGIGGPMLSWFHRGKRP